MSPSPSDTLTLNEAAELLGVHYMTAYRYVRLGQLDARKVGGTWQVDAAALERFRSGITEEGSEAPGHVGRRGAGARSRRAPWARRLEQRLIAGDANGAWSVIEAAMTAGTDVGEVYLDLIAPAMVGIGERWHRGEIDIAVEHRASVIVMRLMGRLSPRTSRRGRTRGSVIVGTPSGEHHSIPTAILADLLRIEGWDVSDIGANVPPESLVFAIDEADSPVAVGLSATAPENVEAVARSCAAVKAAHPDLLLILGGRAVRDHEHALELGGDEYGATAQEMSALIAARLADRSETAS